MRPNPKGVIGVRINITAAGGPCTGKSTLAAALFAALKELEYDYDLITEESRKLHGEFGNFRSPWERFYMWRQQEREELRSTATDGFVTDTALFHYYVQARMHVAEPRDRLAVRELFRMCMEIETRYQLIVIAEDPREIPYKTDQSRTTREARALEKHRLVRSFVEHFWPGKLLLVRGSSAERAQQALRRLDAMRRARHRRQGASLRHGRPAASGGFSFGQHSHILQNVRMFVGLVLGNAVYATMAP